MANLSETAAAVYAQINDQTKLGDLRKMAQQLKTNHQLSEELWQTGEFLPRQLAILLMDKKQLNQAVIDKLDQDIQQHATEEQLQLMDWLMANQLTKHKPLLALIDTWEESPSTLQRRVFWYHQARLRWMGRTDFDNTPDLLTSIENKIMSEQPAVQWAMNYTAGQIGKWQEEHRARCIAIGETTELYKNEVVAKNCTPSYLPEFIRIEVEKLEKLK